MSQSGLSPRPRAFSRIHPETRARTDKGRRRGTATLRAITLAAVVSLLSFARPAATVIALFRIATTFVRGFYGGRYDRFYDFPVRTAKRTKSVAEAVKAANELNAKLNASPARSVERKRDN